MKLEQLLSILELFPEDSMTLYSIGRKYYDMGEEHYDDALMFMMRAVKADAKHIASYYDIGSIYQDQGNFKMARIMFEKGLEMIPQVGPGEGQDLKPDFEDALEEIEPFLN